MPVPEMILNRRSVRQFTDYQLNDEDYEFLLQAAMSAPSACCRDPWHFIILKTPAARSAAAAALPNGGFLGSCGGGIIVCGDPADAHAGELAYLLQDCSAAVENILLAASANGLGGCWLGVHPRMERCQQLQQSFALPDGMLPIAAIALGKPAKPATGRTRFDAAKVHTNKW